MLSVGAGVLAFCSQAVAETDATIVGSSTVTPFAQVAQRKLQEKEDISIEIESTGTGGGFTLFCANKDPRFAPITLASRRLKDTEADRCHENNVGDIEEYEIGLSGVVLIQKKTRQPIHLSRKDLFLALAAETPASETDCHLVSNPRKTWRDVRADLPRWPIEVFGPPLSSGTRASFIELAINAGARRIDCMKRLKSAEPDAYKAAVSNIRGDGAWIDAGENDAVIVTAVTRLPRTMGILGFSRFINQASELSAARIDGIAPTRDSIGYKTYPLARSLWIYAKKDALKKNQAAAAFLAEITAEAAIGPKGYLIEEGLISLRPE